jgi:hypothetical protein
VALPAPPAPLQDLKDQRRTPSVGLVELCLESWRQQSVQPCAHGPSSTAAAAAGDQVHTASVQCAG